MPRRWVRRTSSPQSSRPVTPQRFSPESTPTPMSGPGSRPARWWRPVSPSRCCWSPW